LPVGLNLSVFFQFFIVCALLVAAVAAQDDDAVPPGRTRICKEGEFPGKRNRRQAANPDAPKPCWFIPDASITKGEDCEKKFEETQTCEKSQVFVPLGQVRRFYISYSANQLLPFFEVYFLFFHSPVVGPML
jgi:hypothetical protein